MNNLINVDEQSYSLKMLQIQKGEPRIKNTSIYIAQRQLQRFDSTAMRFNTAFERFHTKP